MSLDPDGQFVKGTDVSLDTIAGDKVSLKPNENLNVAIEISGNKLKVDTPKLVGDRETLRVSPAGSPEALKIPLENRQPFATRKEAKDSGFQV